MTDFHQLMQVIPKTAPAPGDLKKEIRIFYQKLSNELNDLAKLKLPLNLLYKRHVIDIA